MLVKCECGAEKTIHCPPEFLETMTFAFSHGHPNRPPRKVKCVCSCGAERWVGPGAADGTAVFQQGMVDGEWFLLHAQCGKELPA